MRPIVRLQMLRVIDSRKFMVEKPLPKLLVEQVKLLLRKRKRKKTAPRTLIGSGIARAEETCSQRTYLERAS